MATTTSIDDLKATTSYEEKGLAPNSHEVHLPAILAGKSESELEVIRKSATRKLDIYIMPAMVIMYICESTRVFRRRSGFGASPQLHR